MATYEQAVNQIISELTRSDTSITSFVQQEVLQACDFYNSTRFWFNEAKANFITSASQNSYTGTTNILELDSVLITMPGGSKYELEPMNYAVMNALDMGNFVGQPTHYSYFAEAFRLYPTPNASFTIDIAYQARFATLSATGDSNALLTHGLELIKSRAKKNIYADRFKDGDRAMSYAQLENTALDRLILQTEKLLSTGKLSPD